MSKKLSILYQLFFVVFFCALHLVNAQQISTDTSQNPEQIILNSFSANCIEISNITSQTNGSVIGVNSFGTFNVAGSDFPMEEGFFITTGDGADLGNNLNSTPLSVGNDNWGTDSDLENALGITGTKNATSIEFDFISAVDKISLEFIYASEEYEQNFPCIYSDAFAVLIKETGSAAPFANIALIEGTNQPVNSTNIHSEISGFCPADNENLFAGYNLGATNMNGRTVVLNAKTNILPNVQYTLKLVVADQSDSNLDTAVFFNSKSFLNSIDLGDDIQTCADFVTLDATTNIQNISYQWFLDGNPIAGETNSTLQANTDGLYRVEASLPFIGNNCVSEDEVFVELKFFESLDAQPDLLECDDFTGDGITTFNLTTNNENILSSVPAGDFDITFYSSLSDAQNSINPLPELYQNTINNQTIYARIEDDTGECSLYITTFNLIVLETFNNLVAPSIDYEICENQFNILGTINFSDITNTVTGGNTNLEVSYHLSEANAESGINALPNSYNFSNSQTIFIRVFNPDTNCFAITSFDITFLPKVPLSEDFIWLNACITDPDVEFAFFDLTSVIDNITNSATGITTTFHLSLGDANNGTNAITNPENFENTIPNFQSIYVRVVDNNTGCASVRSFELHTDVSRTGYIDTFSICIDSSGGASTIVLDNVISSVLSFYNDDETFEFYLSETDRENGINNITSNSLTVSSGDIIYATISGIDCEVDLDITIEAFPALNLNPVSVFYCDNNQDGFTAIPLSTFNTTVAQGNPIGSVTYYTSLSDAENQVNPLPNTYNNISNPEILYANFIDNNGCVDVTEVTVNVNTPPIVSQPTDVLICDDNQDGLSTINLNSKIPEVVSNTNNKIITFYTDPIDSILGVNAITNPSNFTSSTTNIYIRVEIATNGCYEIVAFEFIVNTRPQFPSLISDFNSCQLALNGETADFIFINKDEEILNGQTDKVVSYHLTPNDADLNLNPIDKTVAYQNVSNPQTIYVRVENITDPDCYGVSNFQLVADSIPVYNDPNDVILCDGIENDGSVFVDLNLVIDDISTGSQDNLSVTFHTSLVNADNSLNQLPLQYSNTLNPQTIFARVENGGSCYEVTSFEIIVLSTPNVNPTPSSSVCDDDQDGITTFNLNDVESDVIDIRPFDNFSSAFYETLEDAENNLNQITNTTNYNNTTPFFQTIYYRVINNDTGCFVVTSVDLIVNPQPVYVDFESIELCGNDIDTIDLNNITNIMVPDQTNYNITYHLSYEDAINDITISTDYVYPVQEFILFAKIVDNNSDCFVIYDFDVDVLIVKIDTQPEDVYLCDDINNDGFVIYDLNSRNDLILGNLDPDVNSITFHNSQADANTGNNPIADPEDFVATNNNLIFVRLASTTIDCFDTASFSIFVNPHINTPSLFVGCDDDTDGLITLDLTTLNSEIYDTTNPNNSINYFSSLGNYNINNPIVDPSNYNNVSNPQTIYAEVFNSIFGCTNLVSFDIEVDLPPIFNNISSIEYCETDDNIYDLTEINDSLIPNSQLYTFEYYESMADAENQTNPLNPNYLYTGNIQIYIRVTNIETGCNSIDTLVLDIISNPTSNIPADLEECDDDYDGFTQFDLSSQTNIISGNLDPNFYSTTCHTSELNAINGANPINNTSNFVGQNNQTIYVRVEELITGCATIISFNLIVHKKPLVDIPQQTLCIDDLPLVVNADTGFNTDTYLWSTNETTPAIEITAIGNYSVTITSEYGCTTTSNFEVVESEGASIDFVETIDFSDPNNITITVSGIGDYLYQLDGGLAQESPFFENVSLGYHTITVIDINGCATVSRRVLVIDYPRFFTPNSDTFNDTWHIVGIETLPGSTIVIYDRMGKVMASLPHDSEGWDGKYNGFNKPASDYWFTANIVLPNANSFQVQGHFALKR